jgi:pyruvate dehydrogenase E2 component (dihydrolipoamide acetyltransferase)
MGEFRMPSLGAGMDAGKLLEWYVAPGDRVKRGDIVALVETDKAAIEVEIFEAGEIEDLVIEEGTKVPVGTVLAHLRPVGAAPGNGAPPPTAAAPAEPDEAAEPEAPVEPAEPEAPAEPAEPEQAAAPVARAPAAARRAAEDRPPDQDRPAAPDQPASTAPAAPVGAEGPAPATPAPPTTDGDRPRSSPYARRLASEQGTAIDAVTGSGPGGAVVARDLRDTPGTAAPTELPAAPATAATSTSREPATAPTEPAEEQYRDLAMRQAIARAMAQSNREIPHYHLGQHVDVEDTLRWLEDRNADRPPAERVLMAAVVLRAVALACREHPDFNGFWIDDALQRADRVNVGVAISLRGGGLMAPALLDTDQMELDDLMSALADLVKRTRAGGLRGSELTGSTITVTNLGDRGVETVHGVIYPPQVSLVGVGRVQVLPAVVDGTVEARRTIHLSLAADHRAGDGHQGSLFLQAIARHLTEPETL